MSPSCSHCGQTWDQDPAYRVPCPSCDADVDQQCQRPSGHPADTHIGRDRLALVATDLEPCPENPHSETIGEAARVLLEESNVERALEHLDLSIDALRARAGFETDTEEEIADGHNKPTTASYNTTTGGAGNSSHGQTDLEAWSD
jgi:predicted  nucleic acid-binding Zn-ribbon protein